MTKPHGLPMRCIYFSRWTERQHQRRREKKPGPPGSLQLDTAPVFLGPNPDVSEYHSQFSRLHMPIEKIRLLFLLNAILQVGRVLSSSGLP